jgi:hypothetical protein
MAATDTAPSTGLIGPSGFAAAGRICSVAAGCTCSTAAGRMPPDTAGFTAEIDAVASSVGCALDTVTMEWRGMGTWASCALDRRMFLAGLVLTVVPAGTGWLAGMHCLQTDSCHAVCALTHGESRACGCGVCSVGLQLHTTLTLLCIMQVLRAVVVCFCPVLHTSCTC